MVAEVTRKHGSLFSGLGGWEIAAMRHGIRSVWASEIEPFPISVTTRHFPELMHLGDITKINGAEIEPVDIITFGSPCQDLSVAGKREGLSGARSGLFGDAVRIIREMRTATGGRCPRFAVWENVPGAFSSNKGEDFRAVIEELCQTADQTLTVPGPGNGKWNPAGLVLGVGFSAAWRVLDAQYWGVPQRRKRIFLVADFGGQRAGEILLKPESLPGYSPAGGGSGQGATGGFESGAGKPICFHMTQDPVSSIDRALCVSSGSSHGQACLAVCVTGDKTHCLKAEGFDGSEDGTGRGQPIVAIGPGGKDQSHALLAHNSATGRMDPSCETFIKHGYRVRRLTPLECERLQGLPDGWTAGGSDTARYKAIGNGMAQPCPDYIMEGIAEVLVKEAES